MPNDIKKTIFDTLSEPLADSLKNITEKPTQNMGKTLADIWYLVFGRFSHAADLQRLKYSYDLENFRHELEEKVAQIPSEKQTEPDFQIVAPALDSAKYCVLHKELRDLFANLISSSLNKDYCKYVHPSFSGIIQQMTPLDAKNIVLFSRKSYYPICNYRVHYKDGSFDDYYKNIFVSNVNELDLTLQSVSMSSLERLGLIKIDFSIKVDPEKYDPFEYTSLYTSLKENILNHILPKAIDLEIIKGTVELTPYGELFIKSCV